MTLYLQIFVDFNEQFTSGSPKYCNESITALTKPSLCGLELNGWNTPWTWQSLTINLPENTAQDQEYIVYYIMLYQVHISMSGIQTLNVRGDRHSITFRNI
jgi:hypothetical protein